VKAARTLPSIRASLDSPTSSGAATARSRMRRLLPQDRECRFPNHPYKSQRRAPSMAAQPFRRQLPARRPSARSKLEMPRSTSGEAPIRGEFAPAASTAPWCTLSRYGSRRRPQPFSDAAQPKRFTKIKIVKTLQVIRNAFRFANRINATRQTP